MIGLLSGPGAVLTVDEAAARRVASPHDPKPDPAPVDAVHAVEPAGTAEHSGPRHHDGQELTTDERLRQDEALHAEPPKPASDPPRTPEPNPDATIDKMRQVRRAALASDDPAAQDRSTAAKAAQVIRAAEAELAARRQETLREAAQDLAEARDAAIVDAQERRDARGTPGFDEALPPAAHRVSEYQRQAVISAGSRLSSIPPPPTSLDESV